MKKLIERLFSVTMLSAALFTACDPDENKNDESYSFPEPQEYVFNLDEDKGEIVNEITINISPDAAWSVSIPADKSAEFGIVSGEDIVTTVGGQAGNYEIRIVCLLEEHDEEEHTAAVTMKIGSETREIGTLYLSSLTPVLVFHQVKVEDGDFVAAAEGSEFDYEYSAIEEGSEVNMVWNASENGYVTYILLEANFETTIPQNADLRVTEINASGRYKEYQVVCPAVNFDDEAGVGYTLTVNSSVEGYEQNVCPLTAPVFVPVFEVRQAVVDETGMNYVYGEEYNWEYSEDVLEEDGTVKLIVRPDFDSVVDNYLLIKSNFQFGIADSDKPSWLSVDEPELQEGTSTDYVKENIFHISAVRSALELEGASGEITFRFGEGFSRTYTVTYDDLSSLFYVAVAKTFNFDASGEYVPSEMGTETNATVAVTAASDGDGEALKIYEFYKNGEWYSWDDAPYAEYMGGKWIETEYQWNTGSADKIQTNPITLSVAGPNETETAREGIIIAIPVSETEGITPDDPGYDIFEADGFTVKEEYAKYVVAYISQAAPVATGGIISPVEPQYWPMEGATFETLSSDPMGLGCDAFKITYTAPASADNPTLGKYLQFKADVPDGTVALVTNTSGEPVSGAYWVEVVSEGNNIYHIEMTPSMSGGETECYIIFTDSSMSSFHAMIDFVYAPAE